MKKNTAIIVCLGVLLCTVNVVDAAAKKKKKKVAVNPEEWVVPYELPPKRPWQARPADGNAEFVKTSCPIIDFGDDQSFTARFAGLRGGKGKGEVLNLDFEKDGKNNDSLAYFAFSLDKPFNQFPDDYRIYGGNNAIFYGGATGYFHNKKPNFSETCINTDYGNMFDDMSFNAYAAGKGEALRVFATYLWKKDDFLNGGDSNIVSFDENSEMHVRISRVWKSYNEGRFVIRIGEQFYLSAYDCDIEPSNEKTANALIVHSIFPAKMKWAKWNPKAPYDLGYITSDLQFEDILMENINVVGWIAAKTDVTPGACWLKWGGFEVKGTVTRPWRPSEAINMRKPAGEDFYIAETETNYEIWRRIYKWFARPQWGKTPGYVFDQNGDMGSMKVGDFGHQAQEPATCMTWYDAVAWCNALSQYEGKRPAYYADPEKTDVLHIIKERQQSDNFDWQPKVYVDWEADGYRLPTISEWKSAYGTTQLQKSAGQDQRTVAVGTGEANTNGLYDMFGNVWEFVWDADDVFDPATQTTHTVLGGGFRHPVDVSKTPALMYGEIPSLGSYNIGFRVLRYEGTGKKPVINADTEVGYRDGIIPEWTFANGEKVLPEKEVPATLADDIKVTMKALDAGTFFYGNGRRKFEVSILPFETGTTEVSYALWRIVYNWAVMNGYTFNHDGAMGSMTHQYKDHTFTADEPATTMSFYDTFLWLNAYSEMTGKTPMYYKDAEKTEVLKLSNMFRGEMYAPKDNNILHSGHAQQANVMTLTHFAYVKWEADGYRLPTEAEWEYMAYAGERYPTMKNPQKGEKHVWAWDNTDGKTMPIGTSEPNAWGLYDVLGNVYEYTWATTKKKLDRENPRDEVSWATIKGGAYSVRSIKLTRRGISEKLTPENFYTGMPKSISAYPELGFRMVRSEPGVQPAEKDTSEKVIWDVDLSTIEAGQGTMYRGNIHRSSNYPTTGVPSLTGLKWKFETSKGIDSSPTVVGDTVYVGCDDGHMYALNKTDGSVKWSFKITGNETVKSTAAIWKDKILTFVGNDNILYGLDVKTGEKIWQQKIARQKGGPKDNFRRGTSPLILKDHVFCNGMESKAAFHVETGENIWQQLDGKGCAYMGSFTYAKGNLYYCGGSAGTGSVSVKTSRGRSPLNNNGGDTFQHTPVSDGIMVFAADGQGIRGYNVNCEANKYGNTVQKVYEYKEKHWTRMHPFFSPMAVDDIHQYVANIDEYIYAVDKKTGKLAWKFKTEGVSYSGASVANGIVYFGNTDGKLYALDAKKGTEKWTFTTDGTINWSSPTPTNGVVYIGASDGLYAIE